MVGPELDFTVSVRYDKAACRLCNVLEQGAACSIRLESRLNNIVGIRKHGRVKRDGGLRTDPRCKIAKGNREYRPIERNWRVSLPDSIIEQYSYPLVVDIGRFGNRERTDFAPFALSANKNSMRLPVKCRHILGKQFELDLCAAGRANTKVNLVAVGGPFVRYGNNLSVRILHAAHNHFGFQPNLIAINGRDEVA